MRRVALSEVTGDQPRFRKRVDEEAYYARVEELAAVMRAGQWNEEVYPPPRLHKNRVIEGFHRVAAARLVGWETLLFEG